jgi:hypothetical protein
VEKHGAMIVARSDPLNFPAVAAIVSNGTVNFKAYTLSKALLLSHSPIILPFQAPVSFASSPQRLTAEKTMFVECKMELVYLMVGNVDIFSSMIMICARLFIIRMRDFRASCKERWKMHCSDMKKLHSQLEMFRPVLQQRDTEGAYDALSSSARKAGTFNHETTRRAATIILDILEVISCN